MLFHVYLFIYVIKLTNKFACVYDTRENNMQVLAKENYYIESSRRWVLWGEMYSLKKSKL